MALSKCREVLKVFKPELVLRDDQVNGNHIRFPSFANRDNFMVLVIKILQIRNLTHEGLGRYTNDTAGNAVQIFRKFR